MRLVEAVADGTPPKSLLEQIKVLEQDLTRLGAEIAGPEARARGPAAGASCSFPFGPLNLPRTPGPALRGL